MAIAVLAVTVVGAIATTVSAYVAVHNHRYRNRND